MNRPKLEQTFESLCPEDPCGCESVARTKVLLQGPNE